MYNPFYVPEEYPRIKMVTGDAAFRYDAFREQHMRWEYSCGHPYGRDFSRYPAFADTRSALRRIECGEKKSILFLFSSRRVQR